jgi:dolichol-phosphate mannosyltransferase
MLRFASDAVTSFAITRLRFAVWLGLPIAGPALLLRVFTLWRWAGGEVLTGWTSMVAALALFAGVQLLVLGSSGEYLGRPVQESTGRPLLLGDAIVAAGESPIVPAAFGRMGQVLARLPHAPNGIVEPASPEKGACAGGGAAHG